MDDIWGSYILQHYFPNSVVYNRASVYQDRNVQDLVTNLENEIIGYRNTLKLIQDLENYENYLPDKAKQFFEIYKNSFNI
jgi:flagellar biosynthesis chaperone FliJ